MAEPVNIKKLDKDYYDTGGWKCPESPTGAHHWRKVPVRRGTKRLFYCIHCLDVKEYPVLYEEAVEAVDLALHRIAKKKRRGKLNPSYFWPTQQTGQEFDN